MKESEYREHLQNAYLYGKIISTIPIPEMIEAINHAEAWGSMIDPTLFIKNGKALGEDKKVLESLLPAWQLFTRIREGEKK